ncbi:MAG: biopolymer transporter ExbD [Prevotellaceae bacterium]|jgi:biopolymer transport protein ExbD|nr:biopolymer transporter ExbD [Prevotellaceae bacterium]
MAEIQQSGGEAKKGKPKKQLLRVDFTPMVDMNMLLITFFMFCTTLSKPQVMDIAMPADEKITRDEDRPDVKDSQTITLILGENDTVFYYDGAPKFDDYTSLKVTNYSPEGLRAYLLQRNQFIVDEMRELRKEKLENKRMTDEEFKQRSKEIKDNKAHRKVVIIKPTDESNYKNLVDALDEMQICSIDVYAIAGMTEGDRFLLNNYATRGEYGKNAVQPKK